MPAEGSEAVTLSQFKMLGDEKWTLVSEEAS